MTSSVTVQTTSKGRGVFASRSFSPDELVLTAQGARSPNRHPHSLQIGADEHLFVDPPVRYLNHSCDPNLGVRTNAQGTIDFVAMRSIAAGEELCFDYAMTEMSLHEVETQAERTSCDCGTENCRGEIGQYATLPEDVKARYKGYLAAHLLEEPGRT
ncbi:MAG: SET domain-containing protein-lysine N-methyltransferase [Deltaproteobacteria bacterium]|nr:MAG: SET domain-containing protein-lysine N-methyltransferase [Deltaproteobacteria bacterium]